MTFSYYARLIHLQEAHFLKRQGRVDAQRAFACCTLLLVKFARHVFMGVRPNARRSISPCSEQDNFKLSEAFQKWRDRGQAEMNLNNHEANPSWNGRLND